MNTRPLPGDERLLDLLATQATEGLDPRQAEQLDRMLGNIDTEAVDTHGLALSAAAVELGAMEASGAVEAMPDSLAARVAEEGRHRVAADTRRQAAAADPNAGAAPARDHRGWKLFSSAALGWLTAAAAILIAATAVFSTITDRGEPEPAAARDNLLQSAEDAIVTPWAQKTPAFADVRGDVVWSDSRQQGYMRLTNMPVNDPTQQQYQLWIVDPQRDEQPVDGGVFNVREPGTVVIPIQAKLPVNDPRAFAITVEKPGGVVVSENELEVVAPVSG